MRIAIESGLESAPMGVVTTPGTKNPKYVPAESTGAGDYGFAPGVACSKN